VARILAGVDEGKISKEQGRARLGAYRKSLGQKARGENQNAEAGESKLVE
jgi:hypothetical protein